jgi:hypothetical protein
MSGTKGMERLERPRWPETPEEIAAAREIFRAELRKMYAEEAEAARRDLAELVAEADRAERATEELRVGGRARAC